MNNGFGGGDVSAFFFWSIQFGVVLSILSLVVLPFLSRLPLGARIAIGLGVGIFSSFLWTVLNRWMLGPWFDAWSFPVLYCWVIGGVVGLVGAIIAQSALLSGSATEHALEAGSP